MTDLKEEIKKGTGKAYYLVKNSKNSNEVDDILFQATIHNLAFDVQVESSRADYIYNLISALPSSDELKKRIITYFKRMRKNDYGTAQVFDLVKLFVKNDDLNIELLYKKIESYITWYKDDSIPGIFPLIELDGIKALLFLADKLGEIVLQQPEYYINDYILKFTDEISKEKSFSVLQKAAKQSGNINAFVKKLNKQSRALKKKKKSVEITYKTVIEYLQRGKRILPYYGRKMSEKDLLQCASALDTSLDNSTKEKMLPLFFNVKYPLGIRPLISYLRIRNTNIVNETLECLSLYKGKQVREIALTYINEPEYTSNALKILANNFYEEDCSLLDRILDNTPDEEDYHYRAMTISDLFKKRRSKACSAILFKIYDRLSCSICRYYVIKRMITNDVITSDIMNEAKYDAYEETRKIDFKKAKNSHVK